MTKIAIFGPKFFGYLETVAAKFSARGVEAHFIDELPSNAVPEKVFLRFAPNWLGERRTKDYYRKQEKALIEGGYTHVLLVAVELFPVRLVRKLREAGIHVSRYAWDSNENKPHGLSLDPWVEASSSFDPDDCERYGYDYIPLFSAAEPAVEDVKKTADFFYCTTFKSDRPAWVRKLLAICERRGWSHNMLLFFHSRPLWFLHYAAAPHLWSMSRMFKTTPFSLDEISRSTARSRVVVDIHHRKQSGLTMRTFEALSMRTIVLTTNLKGMKTLPPEFQERLVFLDPENIEHAMETALSKVSGPLDDEERYYLSIERFIDQLLCLMGLGELTNNERPALGGAASKDLMGTK